jgi:zinc protease
MLRSGGTRKFPADTLDDLIGLLAMRVGFSAAESQFTFSGSFLAEYTGNAFTIIEEMFFHPVFDEKKLEKEKKILLEQIRHRFDNPGPTVGIAFEKCMYPGQAPGRLMSEASVSSITRGDLIGLHKAVFTPGNMIFCISGAFKRDSMKARLDTFFTAAPAGGETAGFPKITINRQPRCLLVHKEISQAYVRLGLPLFQRPHPDFYPISVLNQILGGDGFTSRLGKKIRSDAGLTYSIYSDAESNYTYPAPFFISFFTKNASFAEAVALSFDEVKKFVDGGVTDEELANAKSTLIGELPSMFRSPDDVVSTYGWNEYYHRSPDHYKVYPQKIGEITRNDISRVARQYLATDSMTVTVVGDSTALLRLRSGGFSLAARHCSTILPDQIPKLP